MGHGGFHLSCTNIISCRRIVANTHFSSPGRSRLLRWMSASRSIRYDECPHMSTHMLAHMSTHMLHACLRTCCTCLHTCRSTRYDCAPYRRCSFTCLHSSTLIHTHVVHTHVREVDEIRSEYRQNQPCIIPIDRTTTGMILKSSHTTRDSKCLVENT